MSIRTRLLSVFAGMIVLLGVQFGITAHFLGVAGKAVDTVQIAARSEQAAEEVGEALDRMALCLEAGKPDAEFCQTLQVCQEVAVAARGRILAAAFELVSEPRIALELEARSKELASELATTLQSARAGSGEDWEERREMLADAVATASESYGRLGVELERSLNAALVAETEVHSLPLHVALVTKALLAIAMVLLAFHVGRLVLRPVQALAAAVDVMATQKDLTATAPSCRVGEFATLGAAVGSLAAEFRGALRAVRRVARDLDQSATIVQRVSGGVGSRTKDEVATIAGLGSTIVRIGERSGKNAESSRRASHHSRQAQQLVGSMRTGMVDLTQAMQEVTSSSAEVEKLAQVINDIGFQTNLLALNAAVEAARAGEAGRGFAVVAEQVRNLATRSATAARSAAQVIARAKQSAERGARCVQGFAAQQDDVLAAVEGVQQELAIIDVEVRDQAADAQAMQQGVREVEGAIGANQQGAVDLGCAAHETASNSSLLRQLVEAFRVDGPADQERTASV